MSDISLPEIFRRIIASSPDIVISPPVKRYEAFKERLRINNPRLPAEAQ